LGATGRVLQWLENTQLAMAIAASNWAFPIIEAVHVIALTLVIGTVCIVDLRLLGWASAKRPYRQLAREVLPWTWGAFCLAAISGSLMFITQAAEYYENAAFRIKMVLLLLAGLNMLIFELFTARGAMRWDKDTAAAWPGRLAAGFSLALWICIVFFGRRIGFTMFPG
jgi:hypothetical protein